MVVIQEDLGLDAVVDRDPGALIVDGEYSNLSVENHGCARATEVQTRRRAPLQAAGPFDVSAR